MIKLVETKYFFVFLLLAIGGGGLLNLFSDLGIIYSITIVGIAILLNGLVIMFLDRKKNDSVD